MKFSWPAVFGIVLYLLGAVIALHVTDHFIPEELYFERTHAWFVPWSFPARMLTLWVIMTIPWLVVVYRQKQSLSPSLVFGPLAAVCTLAIWTKPPHNQDLYLYLAQGRQLMLGINPYHTTLWDSMRDPIISEVSKTWFSQLSLYGPLLLLVGATANLIGPNNSLFALGRTLKIIWLLPYWLWGKLCWKHWKKNPDRNLLLIAIFGNPVLIFQALVDGHADLSMVCFLCLTGFLLMNERPLWAALSLSVAACIKMTAMVVVPVASCWLFHKNRRASVKFALGFVTLYGASHAFIAGGEWFNITSFYKSWSDLFISGTVPRILLNLGTRDIEVIHRVCDISFYLAVAVLCLLLLTGRMKSSPFLAMALTFAAFLITRTHVRHWYFLWIWAMLWMHTKNPRYILVSVGLWVAASLFAMMYFPGGWDPHVMLLALIFDLLWLKRQSRESTGRKSQEGKP